MITIKVTVLSTSTENQVAMRLRQEVNLMKFSIEWSQWCNKMNKKNVTDVSIHVQVCIRFYTEEKRIHYSPKELESINTRFIRNKIKKRPLTKICSRLVSVPDRMSDHHNSITEDTSKIQSIVYLREEFFHRSACRDTYVNMAKMIKIFHRPMKTRKYWRLARNSLVFSPKRDKSSVHMQIIASETLDNCIAIPYCWIQSVRWFTSDHQCNRASPLASLKLC